MHATTAVVLLLLAFHHQVNGYVSRRGREGENGQENESKEKNKQEKKRPGDAIRAPVARHYQLSAGGNKVTNPHEKPGRRKRKNKKRRKKTHNKPANAQVTWMQHVKNKKQERDGGVRYKPKPRATVTQNPTLSPTPVSTPIPTAVPLTIPQAAVYNASWSGVTDPGGNCDTPQPGLFIRCGRGGQRLVLDSSYKTSCQDASTTHPFLCLSTQSTQSLAWVSYACVGTTETAWTTKTQSFPDKSVQCSTGGNAGTRISLSQRCPEKPDDFGQIQCNPKSALSTGDGVESCLTLDSCVDDASCNLVTPLVGASIGLDVVSRDCLYPVVFSQHYHVSWSGKGSRSCEKPNPGIVISCGDGGEIAFASGHVGNCEIGDAGEITCNGTGTTKLIYVCRGSTVSSLTTTAKAVPSTFVSCKNGGRTQTTIKVGKLCPEGDAIDVDFLDTKCSPGKPTRNGTPSCFASEKCSEETCNLSTPHVTAFISEQSIVDKQRCVVSYAIDEQSQ